MGYFRFLKRIKVAPGLSINLSKKSVSLSAGVPGLRFSIGPKGRRTSLGLPGTGLSYVLRHSSKKSARVTTIATSRAKLFSKKTVKTTFGPLPQSSPASNLTLGFFQSLTTPSDEKDFVNGCKEFFLGHSDKALSHFRNAKHSADAAFLAGFILLKQGHIDEAATYFTTASERGADLGKLFAKYDLSPKVKL